MKKTTVKKNKQTQGKIPPKFRVLFDSYHSETEKKMTRYLAEQNKKSNEDIKRYIGSLTEEYQGRVSSVAEQHAGTNEKLILLVKK